MWFGSSVRSDQLNLNLYCFQLHHQTDDEKNVRNKTRRLIKEKPRKKEAKKKQTKMRPVRIYLSVCVKRPLFGHKTKAKSKSNERNVALVNTTETCVHIFLLLSPSSTFFAILCSQAKVRKKSHYIRVVMLMLCARPNPIFLNCEMSTHNDCRCHKVDKNIRAKYICHSMGSLHEQIPSIHLISV